MNEETAMLNAVSTAVHYFNAAITNIDAVYDKPGYAEKNPALVIAFVEACSKDYHSSLLYDGLNNIAKSIDRVSDSIDELKP